MLGKRCLALLLCLAVLCCFDFVTPALATGTDYDVRILGREDRNLKDKFGNNTYTIEFQVKTLNDAELAGWSCQTVVTP